MDLVLAPVPVLVEFLAAPHAVVPVPAVEEVPAARWAECWVPREQAAERAGQSRQTHCGHPVRRALRKSFAIRVAANEVFLE